MPRTRVRQDEQIHASELYDDTITPTQAAFETNPLALETDMNNVRSLFLYYKNKQVSGNWYDVLATPTTFTGEGEGPRGIDNLNQDLHDIERKRILRRHEVIGSGVGPIATNAQHAILNAAGELPGNTTVAVGAVTTIGTIAAYEASFDSATLTEVAGADALSPKSLCKVSDSATGDVIVDGTGREVHALLQSESNTDGHTATTTTPNRLQLSFVVHNATNDDLELVAAGVMDNKTIDYAPVERYAFDAIPEEAWLGNDFTDVGAASTTRQGTYDNQGVTPVDVTTNSILDLEGAGIAWRVRDDAEANLFSIIEGSAGGTSEIEIGADVDVLDVDAVDVDFTSGISVASGKTRPIDIGETDGVIESTAGNLELQAATELILSDGNESAGWSLNGILLSDTSAEWDAFESEFGEVSLLAAVVAAKQSTERQVDWAAVNQNISANTLITGAGGTPNVDNQLPSYKGLTFVSAVEVYINGVKQRPGADASANNDVYPSAVATDQGNGAFYCEYDLKYRGGSNPDNINMVVWGQPDA